MTLSVVASKVRRFVDISLTKARLRTRLSNALVHAVYSRPSGYWGGLKKYCLWGNRHDLVKVQPPGVKNPIFLRRGTSDIHNFEQIFVDKEYDFLPLDPLTILDLGGYIGLASIWLANEFPNAKILLVEPDPDNYAMALLNCRGYENINCLNVGVWSKSCVIALSRQEGGDWGNMFEEVVFDEGDTKKQKIEAKSVCDLMAANCFESVDFLKIDIEGSEKVLFEASDSFDWIKRCQVISCELHDRMVPGCSDSVHDALSRAGFSARKHGEFDYFVQNSI